MTGRHDEALKASTPLLAAMQKRFGPDHRFTLALHSPRFDSFAALGHYDAAAPEAERVWRGAAPLAGPQSHHALVRPTDYPPPQFQNARHAQALGSAQQPPAQARTTALSSY